MKKIGNTLVYIGFMGVLGCIILKLLHYGPLLYPVIASHTLIIAGLIFVLPPLLRRRRSLFSKLVVSIIFLGLILIYAGWVARSLHWGGYSPMLLSGYSILFVTVILQVTMSILGRLGAIRPKGKPTSVETLMALGLTAEDLDKFEGVYNNEKMPLKITIKNREATLVAQATGQSAFYLDAISSTEFEYRQGDIGIEFFPEKNELLLKQHGGFFPFVKEHIH